MGGNTYDGGNKYEKWFAVIAIAVMMVAMPSQSEAQVSVRLGLSSMTGVAGIEYQKGNSLWAGLAFVLNAAEVVEEDVSFEDAPQVGPLVGYRIDLNESFDLSIGRGYGVYLGADAELNTETGGPLLDFSSGYSF